MRPDDGGSSRPPLPAEAGPNERTLYEVYDFQTGHRRPHRERLGHECRVRARAVGRRARHRQRAARCPRRVERPGGRGGVPDPRQARRQPRRARRGDRPDRGGARPERTDSATAARTDYVTKVRSVSLDVDPADYQRTPFTQPTQVSADLPTVLDQQKYDQAVAGARAAREQQAAAVLATFTDSMTTATKKLPVEPVRPDPGAGREPARREARADPRAAVRLDPVRLVAPAARRHRRPRPRPLDPATHITGGGRPARRHRRHRRHRPAAAARHRWRRWQPVAAGGRPTPPVLDGPVDGTTAPGGGVARSARARLDHPGPVRRAGRSGGRGRRDGRDARRWWCRGRCWAAAGCRAARRGGADARARWCATSSGGVAGRPPERGRVDRRGPLVGARRRRSGRVRPGAGPPVGDAARTGRYGVPKLGERSRRTRRAWACGRRGGQPRARRRPSVRRHRRRPPHPVRTRRPGSRAPRTPRRRCGSDPPAQPEVSRRRASMPPAATTPAAARARRPSTRRGRPGVTAGSSGSHRSAPRPRPRWPPAATTRGHDEAEHPRRVVGEHGEAGGGHDQRGGRGEHREPGHPVAHAARLVAQRHGGDGGQRPARPRRELGLRRARARPPTRRARPPAAR